MSSQDPAAIVMERAPARGPVETIVGRRGRVATGGFFLITSGVHLGIVMADPSFYARFANGALLPLVRHGWAEVFMAAPAFWGLCLFLGEVLLGVLLLAGGRAARVGWAGVIAFHVVLMLFGFGFWVWSLPALLLLVFLARSDWPALGSRGGY